jgi:hypothetical protein
MSTSESFAIWRDARRIWEEMHQKWPEGYDAEITVYFMDGERIIPSHVWREGQYLVFSMGGDAQEDIRVAAAREEFVARIDWRYVKSKGAKPSTGFQVTEQGEPPPLPEPDEAP